MENDSVRTIGENTVVDVWIDGKMRSVTVARAVIEVWAELPAGGSAAMPEDERSEFVRTHLARVVRAAKDRLRNTNPDADAVVIGAASTLPAGDRRQGDRRKGDRRKAKLGPPPSGERRGS